MDAEVPLLWPDSNEAIQADEHPRIGELMQGSRARAPSGTPDQAGGQVARVTAQAKTSAIGNAGRDAEIAYERPPLRRLTEKPRRVLRWLVPAGTIVIVLLYALWSTRPLRGNANGAVEPDPVTTTRSPINQVVAQGRPVITELSAAAGRVTGGTRVVITGSRLSAPTAVRFGSTPAASFSVIDDNHIDAVAPARSPGAVWVEVATAEGTTEHVPASLYTSQ